MSTTGIIIVVGIVGIIIGWILGKLSSSQQGEEVAKLKQELESVQTKLKAQVEHFEASENIFHKLASDFKSLYIHMKDNDYSTLEEKFKGLIIESEEVSGKIEHELKDDCASVEKEIEEVIHETEDALNKQENTENEEEKSAETTVSESVEQNKEESDQSESETTSESESEKIEDTEVKKSDNTGTDENAESVEESTTVQK